MKNLNLDALPARLRGIFEERLEMRVTKEMRERAARLHTEAVVAYVNLTIRYWHEQSSILRLLRRRQIARLERIVEAARRRVRRRWATREALQ